MSYEVHLDVFEGPFQLLLSLIGERRVDVCEISIAKLTEDYLDHLARLEQMDLEITTEFLVVAATLLQLKARALLPDPSAGDEDDADDVERDLLIARLLEVRTFLAAGGHLADLLAGGDTRFPPIPAPDDESLRQLPMLADISPADLARTLVDIIREQQREIDVSLLVGEEISTQEAAGELLQNLADGPVTFSRVAGNRTAAWAIALFLAMLELAMRGEIRLGAGERVGDIEIELTQGGSEA